MKYQITVKAKTFNTIYGAETLYYPMYRKKVRLIFQWLIPFSYYGFLHYGKLKNMRFESLSNAWEFAASITPDQWNARLNMEYLAYALSITPGEQNERNI